MPAVYSDYKSLAAQAMAGDLGAIGRAISTLLGLVGDVTPGTAKASRAVILDANGAIDTITVTTGKVSVTDASTAANLSNSGITTLSSTATSAAYTMAAPAAGIKKVITQTGPSTAITVTLASGTFDGTNQIATFNASKDTIELVGLSTSRMAVVSNIGSVAFSTS